MSEPEAILLPAEVVRRQRPRQFAPIDEHLWAAEYEKEFVEVRGIVFEKVHFDRFFFSRHPLYHTTRSLPSLMKVLVKTVLSKFLRIDFKMDLAVSVVDEFSQDSYFHWLGDVVPRLEILMDTPWRQIAVVIPNERRSFIGELLGAFPITIHTLRPFSAVQIERLIVIPPLAPTGNYRPWVMQRIRERFWKHYGLTPHPWRKIWVSRQKAPKRKIVNESDIEPLLQHHGWELVCMEDLDFPAQVRLMSETKALGGLHGAGLTNMVFMPPGGHVLEVRFRGDAHNNCYFSLASAMDHGYWYVLADFARGSEVHDADARVEKENFQDILQRLESHLNRECSNP